MIKKFYKFIKENCDNFKYQILIYIFLSIFGAALETISIGILIPLFTWIFTKNYHLIIGNFDLNSYFNLTNKELFLTFVIFIILIFFLKLIFFFIYEIFKNNLILRINQKISVKVFQSFIFKSYKFFSSKNSAEIINSVRSVDEYSSGTLSSILKIIIDLITLLFFLTLLILVDFKTTIIIFFVLFFLCQIIYFFTRKFLKKKGKDRYLLSKNLYQLLGETFRGIREVKIYSLQTKFISMFENTNFYHYKNAMTISLINFFPKILIEFLIVLFFLLLILFLNHNNNKFDESIILLGTLVLVALRVMPILLRILHNLQVIKSRFFAFETIQNSISQNIDTKMYFSKSTNDKQKIILNKIYGKNIDFSYDKNIIFENLNFEFTIGEIIGIAGSSGSGKSTLVDLISGLIKPNKGLIMYDKSYDINDDQNTWLKNISYISQNSFLFDGSIKDNILLGATENKINSSKMEEIFEILDLNGIVKNLPDGIETGIGESGSKLSGGQRQRIGIARALYKNSSILIFDESTSGLDLKSEKEIMLKISKLKNNKIILIISHRKETLEICNKKFIIKEKKLLGLD